MSRRRGNAVIVVSSLATLLGMAAAAVDIGLVETANAQLQVALDAAALAGTDMLDSTPDGFEEARALAVAIAAEHDVLGTPVQLQPSDISFGQWTDDGWADAAFPPVVDAMRIRHATGDVRLTFGHFAYGVSSLPLRGGATARRSVGGNAASTECYLPFAMPRCTLTALPEGTNPPPSELRFTNSHVDNVGWASPVATPSASWAREQITDRCSSAPIEVGSTVHVGEGQLNSVLMQMASILNDLEPVAPDPWPDTLPFPARDGVGANLPSQSDVLPPNWGNTIQGPVAIVDMGGNCSNPSWTGTREVTGIAWGTIYDVDSMGGVKNLWLQLDVVNSYKIVAPTTDEGEGNVLGSGPPRLETRP